MYPPPRGSARVPPLPPPVLRPGSSGGAGTSPATTDGGVPRPSPGPPPLPPCPPRLLVETADVRRLAPPPLPLVRPRETEGLGVVEAPCPDSAEAHAAVCDVSPAAVRPGGETNELAVAVPGRQLGSCMVSFFLHMVLLLVLALIVTPADAPQRVAIVIETSMPEEPAELPESPVELPVVVPEIEPMDPQTAVADIAPDPFIELATVIEDPLFEQLVPDDGPESIAAVDLLANIGRGGEGQSFDTDGIGSGVEFFGVKGDGGRIVFVTDCSGSMDGLPLQRLKEQLHSAIGSLAPRSEFFVVFFNHGAIPMPAEKCVQATPAHNAHYLAWIDGIQADGGTDPSEALSIALRLEPSTIFLLTDGVFPPEPTMMVLARLNKNRRLQINTIAIGLHGAEPVLRRIAEENNGEYKFVAQ
jgi:hypothetical protein